MNAGENVEHDWERKRGSPARVTWGDVLMGSTPMLRWLAGSTESLMVATPRPLPVRGRNGLAVPDGRIYDYSSGSLVVHAAPANPPMGARRGDE